MSPALAADGWAGKAASRRQVGRTVLNRFRLRLSK